ncbi:MAG TPA: hypothetical protein VE957_08155 [Terriglobales bacterium]|nr:hypothetical protein [Terriglobales bacterium]
MAVNLGRNAAITETIQAGYSFSGMPPYCSFRFMVYGGEVRTKLMLRFGTVGIRASASPQTILFT